MNIRAHYTKEGGHYRIRVFIGKSPDLTHALSGVLSISEHELDIFKELTNWTWIDDSKALELISPKPEPPNVEGIRYCGVTNCTNKATHTWSGHPTCDDCATPTRKAGLKKIRDKKL